MNALELDRVTLGYAGRTVLSAVDLAIPEGAFVGLLGANGAGKTTLLRAVLGLVTPEAGQLRVLGGPATRGNPAIGYVPQTRARAPSARLRGRDMVGSALAGHRWGLPWLGDSGRREVDRVLDLVDGAALAARPIDELSGGERQRLLVAQALLGQPRLLLLDEPLAGLDPNHQSGVVALVRQVQMELGITVVFSAHDLNPLLGVLDQVLYLGRQRAALGAVDAVMTEPVLSLLYGAPMEVHRVAGRIFVMAHHGNAIADTCGAHVHV